MKLFGSSLILSGTALGAGMLAIPMVLAQFGFMISSVLMLLIFIGTTYSALLLAEACTKTKDNSGMSSVA
ncbi:aromatic amino acid transport family protein, partial [Vibrio splendidus]